MEALRRDHPAAVPRFYEALLPRVLWATVHGSWKAPWWPQSYPSHATAADDATFDGPIRGSVAPAFAAAGGGGGGLRRWCCTRIRRLASLGRC
jgi:hypothetical protein